jgi:NAD(P)-dependent dehydrogenase (short-subunit alcohol dehydrogenase family)
MIIKMKVDNEVAVIIGGTGDIGHATAHLFVQTGANVIITGREQARAEERASTLGPKARGIAVDPGDEKQLHALFAETGPIDYLVLTLGTQAVSMPFAQLPEEQLLRGINEKFLYYTRALRASLGKVKESITWLTWAALRTAIAGLSNYAASNGALHAMIAPLAVELAPVRINCVAAGLTRTNFWNRLGMSPEVREAMFADGERSILLRHVAAPEEIAHALLFAATNRYTTGTILDTNGGLHLGRVNIESEQPALGSVQGNRQ